MQILFLFERWLSSLLNIKAAVIRSTAFITKINWILYLLVSAWLARTIRRNLCAGRSEVNTASKKSKNIYLTWNITTLPPLSPVARSSPSWLNSTQEIRSASVTSSSRVPFTWLKHHVVSPPLPGTASPSIKNRNRTGTI